MIDKGIETMDNKITWDQTPYHKRPLNANSYFDLIIESSKKVRSTSVRSLPHLIFQKLAHRKEDSEIILSHDGNTLVSVSLPRLRFIVLSLFKEFQRRNIRQRDTILMASISGNNELFIALLFTALAAFGVRVLLPMFMETKELVDWIKLTNCRGVILPGKEIFSLNHHEKEKGIIKDILDTASLLNLPGYDAHQDLRIRELLYGDFPDIDFPDDPLVKQTLAQSGPETEAMIITTSGSSGRSKLVVYEQGAFIRSCLSWSEANFFSKNKLGGRGFTPLFTHTMGVRAYFNALWTGTPVCLINTEWLEEKPEIVRYFIMHMKPEHITGGPSVFNLLLELMRTFPEIKHSFRRHIKTIVSSGAPHNSKTFRAVESAFGIKMHNAYGTTETQQALSTVLDDNAGEETLKTLGPPLPGVKIGLKKISSEDNLYQLFINSPFGAKTIIKDKNNNSGVPNGYFYLGDIIKLTKNNRIIYAGRENRDFLKDGFGVKIPLNSMKDYYKKIYKKAKHIEYYPVKNQPGLGALIFIENRSLPRDIVDDIPTIKTYSCLLAEINSSLYKILEPFEYRHRLVTRFMLVNSPVPKTRKGTVSKFQIETQFKDVIDALGDPFSQKAKAEIVERKALLSNSLTQHLNPYIGKMLSGAGIDYSYHRGEKDTLYAFRDGKEIEILDLVGGYGTNLLGHNHRGLKNSLFSFLNSDEISLSDQASIQRYAGELAEKLNLTVGAITGRDYNVLLGSTGSEAVEMALHHALFEWQKAIDKMESKQYKLYADKAGDLVREAWDKNRKILSSAPIHVITLKNAFHGNTSGSRALLGNQEKRLLFQNMTGIKPIFIDDRSPDWKKQIEKSLKRTAIRIEKIGSVNGRLVKKKVDFDTVIAAIAEPIIGEGGVRIVDKKFLKHLSKFRFPLIMDEIQCGLGRSGSFLASEGIEADYYLFAKTLGGGFEKISAVLIDKDRYKEKFGELYLSTFSNGGMAACTALEVLSIIKRENLPQRVLNQGVYLSKKLKKIQRKYPGVIDELTGRGLMQGIRFKNFSDSGSFFLRVLYEKKLMGLFFSSYLLRKHNIRILPTLSAPNILRVEPSAYITTAEIDRFADALEELAEKLDGLKLYELCLPLLDGDPFEDNKGKKPKQGYFYTHIDKPAPGSVQVAFIAHFTYPLDELRLLEKEFCQASDTGLRLLFNKIQMLMEMKPFVLFAKNIFRGKVHFTFICLPLDSASLEQHHKEGKSCKVLSKIQDAVDLAAGRGAKVVSLGGYTSILSNNASAILEPRGVKVITGNTLTAASGIRRLVEDIKRREEFQKKNTLAVIGAAGNIGSIITEKLLERDDQFKKIILIGRNGNKQEKLAAEMSALGYVNKNIELAIAEELSALKECDVITVAANTSDPIIFPHHIAHDFPVLISDMSVPSAVSPEVKKMKNVINHPFVSYITLSEDPDFIMSSCTPRGSLYCCAAEAILCGLERVDVPLRGRITVEAIDVVSQLADKYHFFNGMGSAKSFKGTE